MQQKKFSRYIMGGVILLILVVWIVSSYNSLVKKEEKIKLQWSEIQSTYQRRLDLIPNLVNIVKGVSDFEQSTLEQITQARSRAVSGLAVKEITADNYQQQQKQQDELAGAANRLIIAIEKYPTLKGTAAYAGLQTQLEGTERRIQIARKDFNEAVNLYNQKVRGFPSGLIAAIFGFKKKDGFAAGAGTDKTVEINFKK